MKLKAYLIILYGLIILAGGIIGHIKAGSTASLISGLFFGVLLIASGIGMIKESVLAYFSGIVLLAVLLIFFCYRFYITAKFMPPGMLALVTLAVMVGMLFRKKCSSMCK